VDNEGYPEQRDLDLIRAWDCEDVFNLINYLYNCWHFQAWGFKQEWKYDNILNSYKLHLGLHTGGWSGNEELMGALLDNNILRSLWYAEWRRGGHYKFEINPFNVGYKLVAVYCKDNNVSRQYIHKIKDRFDWVIISKNKRMIRPKI